MAEHSIFYYPYGSFGDRQAPLLKVAAIYFDKVFMLDPTKASADDPGGVIGVGAVGQDVRILEQEGILERVAPEQVLAEAGDDIADAVRADMDDPAFVELCRSSGTRQEWQLALAKVPAQIRDDPAYKPLDQSMQQLMGDLPRRVAAEVPWYEEEFVRAGDPLVYDEYRETNEGEIEYRHARYPLPLGESIMVNHALWGGLVMSKAAPLTDDPFHRDVFALKLDRAQSNPEVRAIFSDFESEDTIKRNLAAGQALQDRSLRLPVMQSDTPLDEILEYRRSHDSELQAARDRMGWLAQRIRETPWDQDFERSVHSDLVPTIHDELEAIRKTRDSWFRNRRGLVFDAAVLAASVGTLVLNPMVGLPIVVGVVGSIAIPGLKLGDKLLAHWQREEKNGLHYLLRLPS